MHCLFYDFYLKLITILIINFRYDDKVWEKPKNESQDHLSELLKKIQERKRLRETALTVESLGTTAPDIVTTQETGSNKATAKKIKKNKGVQRKFESSENIQFNADQSDNKVNNNDGEVPLNADSADSVKQNFTILGSHKRVKTQTAKRVLPDWLTQPQIVSSDLKSGPSLKDIQTLMDVKLLKKLEEDGFNQLFPVQSQVFSWLLQCDHDYKAGRWVRDTCISMPTGSGN